MIKGGEKCRIKRPRDQLNIAGYVLQFRELYINGSEHVPVKQEVFKRDSVKIDSLGKSLGILLYKYTQSFLAHSYQEV